MRPLIPVFLFIKQRHKLTEEFGMSEFTSLRKMESHLETEQVHLFEYTLPAPHLTDLTYSPT